jgi:dihydrodipicolinate reductase
VTAQQFKIAVVGAGGKMGMRVANNLQRSPHDLRYVENSPAGQQRTLDASTTTRRQAAPFEARGANWGAPELNEGGGARTRVCPS